MTKFFSPWRLSAVVVILAAVFAAARFDFGADANATDSTDTPIFAAFVTPEHTVDLAFTPPANGLSYVIWRRQLPLGSLTCPATTPDDKLTAGWIGDADEGVYAADDEAFTGERYGSHLCYTVAVFDKNSQELWRTTQTVGMFDLTAILAAAAGGKCPSERGAGYRFTRDEGWCVLRLDPGVFEISEKINFYRWRAGLDDFDDKKTALNGLVIMGAGTDQTAIRPRTAAITDCADESQCVVFGDDRVAQFHLASGGFGDVRIDAPELEYGIFIFNPFIPDLTPDSVVGLANIVLAGQGGTGVADASGLRQDSFDITRAEAANVQRDRLTITDSIITGWDVGLETAGGSPALSDNIFMYNTENARERTDGIPVLSEWSELVAENNSLDDDTIEFLAMPSRTAPELWYLDDFTVLEKEDDLSADEAAFWWRIPRALAATSSDWTSKKQKLIKYVEEKKTGQSDAAGDGSANFGTKCGRDLADKINEIEKEMVAEQTDEVPFNYIDLVAEKMFSELHSDYLSCLELITVTDDDPTSSVRERVIALFKDYMKILSGYTDLQTRDRVYDPCVRIVNASRIDGDSIAEVISFEGECESDRLNFEKQFALDATSEFLALDSTDELYRPMAAGVRRLTKWLVQANEAMGKINRSFSEYLQALNYLNKQTTSGK